MKNRPVGALAVVFRPGGFCHSRNHAARVKWHITDGVTAGDFCLGRRDRVRPGPRGHHGELTGSIEWGGGDEGGRWIKFEEWGRSCERSSRT